jgi:hypothetical protein
VLQCSHAFVEVAVDRGAGPFRSMHVEARRCTRCGALAMSALEAQRFFAQPALGGDETERDRRPTRVGCSAPSCFGNLDQVTLGWDRRWLVVEQCARCAAVIVDPAAIERLRALRR